MRANQIKRITIDFKMDVTKTKIYIKQLDPKYIVLVYYIFILYLLYIYYTLLPYYSTFVTQLSNKCLLHILEHNEINIGMGFTKVSSHLHSNYFPHNFRHNNLFVVLV